MLLKQIEALEQSIGAANEHLYSFEHNEDLFIESAVVWLSETAENLTELCPMLSVALLALRGNVLAERMIEPDDCVYPAKTMLYFTQGISLLYLQYRNSRSQCEQFEKYLIDIVLVGHRQQMFEQPREPRGAWLAQVWTTLVTHTATANVAAYLTASLPIVDRIRLLDRILYRLYSH